MRTGRKMSNRAPRRCEHRPTCRLDGSIHMRIIVQRALGLTQFAALCPVDAAARQNAGGEA